MIRAAAKNHKDVVVIAAKSEYAWLEKLLEEQKGETTLEQRRPLAAKAFEVCAHYDVVIARYFNPTGLFPGIRRCAQILALWRKSTPGGPLLWPACSYFRPGKWQGTIL